MISIGSAILIVVLVMMISITSIDTVMQFISVRSRYEFANGPDHK